MDAIASLGTTPSKHDVGIIGVGHQVHRDLAPGMEEVLGGVSHPVHGC